MQGPYLASASALADFQGKTVLPEIFTEGEDRLEIEEGLHPYHFFSGKTDSVANSISISAVTDINSTEPKSLTYIPTGKTFFLTGPNAGGKTHYLRMVSQLILLAQSKRLAVIAKLSNQSDKPVFAVLDEVLTGTSTDQHWAAELATIKYLHGLKNLISIVASHDRSHGDLRLPGLVNIHVSLEGFEIRPGVSMDYNAFDVMDRADVPKEITDEARRLHRERYGDKGPRKGIEP